CGQMGTHCFKTLGMTSPARSQQASSLCSCSTAHNSRCTLAPTSMVMASGSYGMDRAAREAASEKHHVTTRDLANHLLNHPRQCACAHRSRRHHHELDIGIGIGIGA